MKPGFIEVKKQFKKEKTENLKSDTFHAWLQPGAEILLDGMDGYIYEIFQRSTTIKGTPNVKPILNIRLRKV